MFDRWLASKKKLNLSSEEAEVSDQIVIFYHEYVFWKVHNEEPNIKIGQLVARYQLAKLY